MKEQVNYNTFDKISNNMARKFGTIKKGREEEYNSVLFPMEANLLKINRKYGINNGRRAMEAIHICLFTINEYLNQIEYDLSPYITKDNEAYVKALQMGYDPFINSEIQKLLNKKYDLNSIKDLHEYFEVPVKCLLRIERSIDLWTKEYGVIGYFNFLEEQLGRTVKNDDKMDFAILFHFSGD